MSTWIIGNVYYIRLCISNNQKQIHWYLLVTVKTAGNKSRKLYYRISASHLAMWKDIFTFNLDKLSINMNLRDQQTARNHTYMI